MTYCVFHELFELSLAAVVKAHMENYKKGRGAQINPTSKFEHEIRDHSIPEMDQGAEVTKVGTKFIDTHAKTIVNKVPSPDIGMDWSVNPYQGCEHGCIYCYARNTHPYWGYSAGLDFETKIMVKRNAPELLDTKLRSKGWKAAPIMLSGNTDCYQPVERKLRITRKLLEVLWKYRHPVGIITKNSPILRDMDILTEMSKLRLVKVSISINAIDEELRQKLEPRTASYKRRIHTISELSNAGVPVNAMIAPVIPGLTDHQILETARVAAEAGAMSLKHIVVRLNGDVEILFKDWLRKNFPDRANKVIHKIESVHGGKVNDSRFGTRMSGEGSYSSIISDQVRLARKMFFSEKSMPEYDLDLYEQTKNPQLGLW